MAESQPLLQLSDVTKRYPAPDGRESASILDGIHMTIAAGESVSVVGPSGSGKSTLLNIIGGLDSPTSGTVTLNGRDISHLDQNQLANIRNQEIGFVFQQHHLLPQLSVLENVMVPCLMVQNTQARQKSEERARQLLERVGLKERIDYWPGQISGGERQRVAVVRALINEPNLLLADEPTGSLDRAASDGITKLLIELNEQEGIALVVVTHAMDLARQMKTQYEIRDARLSTLDENHE